ncbi:MAG: hypothetical protein JXJ04_06165 [Spirochaetales bacterium]|nr:hypothetical protein [Spirochaetales bacterium]
MSAAGFFLASPFFWFFLSALSLGAGISRVTRFIKVKENLEKAKNRKWIEVCICFSFSILFAICSIIVPGARELVNINYLYVYLILAVISFLGFRFKKTCGIPFLFLTILCFILFLLFFQALTSFTGETEIAQLHVFRVKDNSTTMELILPDGSDNVLEMKGVYFAPVVKIIILDDLLVFFGGKTWYRFVGIITYPEEKESEILIPADKFELPAPPGIPFGLYKFVETYEHYIPGIKSAQQEVVQKKAVKMTSYSIKVQNDGGVIVEVME